MYVCMYVHVHTCAWLCPCANIFMYVCMVMCHYGSAIMLVRSKPWLYTCKHVQTRANMCGYVCPGAHTGMGYVCSHGHGLCLYVLMSTCLCLLCLLCYVMLCYVMLCLLCTHPPAVTIVYTSINILSSLYLRQHKNNLAR